MMETRLYSKAFIRARRFMFCQSLYLCDCVHCAHLLSLVLYVLAFMAFLSASSMQFCRDTMHYPDSLWRAGTQYMSKSLIQRTYYREKAVHHLQVGSPQLRHTSTLCRYIVRLYSRTDDCDTLYTGNVHYRVILKTTS